MGKIELAVDTSGRTGSVAVGKNGAILAEKVFSGQMRHGAELFTSIKNILSAINSSPADIGTVYVTVGPGSFTGLRIGISMAKMMYLANPKINILPVSTMDGLVENIKDQDAERVGTILDAKRGQFFTAVFEKKGSQFIKTIDDNLCKVDDFFEMVGDKPIKLLGEGLVYYKDAFKKANIEFFDEQFWPVKAKKLFAAGAKASAKGDFADAVSLKPAYLRGSGAKLPSARKK